MFPLCSPDVPGPVSACRTVCETVKIECSVDPVLKMLWPKFIDCEALPQPDQHELCMQVPKDNEHSNQEDKDTQKISNNKLKPAIPSLLSSSLSSSASSASSSSSPSSSSSSSLMVSKSLTQQFWPWTPWKNNLILRGNNGGGSGVSSTQLLCPTNFTLSFLYDDNNDGKWCARQCGMDALFTSQQKHFTRAWILYLSAICFILTLFSLVTFWAEPMRFGYPERPVLFLALCYNLLSMCYLERIIFHNSIKESIYDETNVCVTSAPCLASYITTSYLTLSAATWWLIFSLCWYLSTKKQWSSEALEKKSGLFHVLAWVPPLAPPIGALLWGAVTPQELTGMCTAYGFVEIPTIILLLAGAILSISASKSLRGLSRSVNDDSFIRRLLQVRIRIILFSCVFFIPAFLAIILAFFEKTDTLVRPCTTKDNCEMPDKHTPLPTVIRLFFMLAGGSLAGMWVWSKKTCESYRTRIIASPSTTSSSSAAAIVTNIKSCNSSSLTKKPKATIGPLYAGINFHNVPVCHVNNN